jgi:hypothetical protein
MTTILLGQCQRVSVVSLICIFLQQTAFLNFYVMKIAALIVFESQ